MEEYYCPYCGDHLRRIIDQLHVPYRRRLKGECKECKVQFIFSPEGVKLAKKKPGETIVRQVEKVVEVEKKVEVPENKPVTVQTSSPLIPFIVRR